MSQAPALSRLCLFALIATLAAGPLLADDAAEPWEAGAFAADPAEMLRVASAVKTDDAEAGVVVLFSEQRVSFDEAGRASRVRRVVYRIVNASADEGWSSIEEQWSPWYQERPQLRARVVTPDGEVHQLDPSTVAEAATSQRDEMFDDERILRAPLPATGPGAVVEIEVTGRDTVPFFDRGTVQLQMMRLWVPIRHARLSVDAPEGLPLRHVVRALPEGGAREEVLEGRRRLTFDYRDLPAYDDFELGVPADVPWLAYVGFSTGPSWSAIAQRYSEIVEETIRGAEGAGALRSFLRAADAPAKTPRETIDRLLARLGTEVRYTGVELGEGSIIPRPPAETLRRKFGDCKDKAVLLTALLRLVDIPAHVALLRAGEHWPDVEESLPGMGSFNHAIVVVPGEPAIWIDPTDRYARAGELPPGDQGRLALIASATAEGLVRTPEATAAENREVETREFFLSDLGPARVVETSEMRGVAERDLRASYSGQDEKTVRDSLSQYTNRVYMTDKIGKIDHSDPVDLSDPFRLRIEVEESRRGYTDVPSALVAVFPAATLSRLPSELTAEAEEGETRKAEYYLTRPHTSEVRYRIVPPAGFRPQPLPPGRVRQLGPATLSEEYAAADDGTVTATLRFEIDKRRLSADEFEALRKGAREIDEEDAVLVHFEQAGESHLAAGRVREAIDEFEQLAALSPKKALPRLRIARALLAGGMGEPAREEARRAIDLEPSFAPAWRDLAWILQHDEVGRRFGQGFDRAGALAAYRKAKELDPEDWAIRADLAILLEHDAKGRRYTRDADLAAAIDEYRALKTELDEEAVDDNLAAALLQAGRFEELKEHLDKLETTPTRSTLRLVALAATQGAEAAAREAERRFSDPEARRNALEEASGSLMQARRYAEAADLLERAGRRAPNAAEILARVEMLRKTRRHEELSIPSDTPDGLTKRFFLVLGSGAADPEGFLGYFSRTLLDELGKDEKARRELQEGLAALEGFANDGEIPTDVVLDLGLSALRQTVTGDDALGYRVVLATAFGNQESAYYLVREEGGYKIGGFGDEPNSMGLEALARLERGDLAGARRWLDWAREEVQALGGDDPLPGPPFATLWTRGAEATVEEARCAAASLLAGSDASEKAVPLLLACRETAPEGARRTALDLALALSYQPLKRYADMAETAQRLGDVAPGSLRAYGLLNVAFIGLDRWDDVRRLAEQRLATNPDDPAALTSLYAAAEKRGDIEEAEKHLQRIVDAGKADSTVFNNLAWLALFRGKVNETSVEQAQRATMLEEYGNSSSLHTLASLYAELGRTAEAYQVILQALEAGGKSPEPHDWYVFGRLAEHYGLPDAARHYYAKVTPPEQVLGTTESISTYKLAQKRLAVLGPEVKEAKKGRRK
jgi:tetratricopeptide (TPR) repeat protein/transglutaminase-like putative cysteine protease